MPRGAEDGSGDTEDGSGGAEDGSGDAEDGSSFLVSDAAATGVVVTGKWPLCVECIDGMAVGLGVVVGGRGPTSGVHFWIQQRNQLLQQQNNIFDAYKHGMTFRIFIMHTCMQSW